MKTTRTLYIGSLILLSVVSLSRGQAATPAAAPPPTKLAVVNLVTLFDGLVEKADADGEIDAMKTSFETQAKDKQAKIEKMQNDVAHPVFRTDSEEFKKLQDDLLQESFAFRTFTDFYRQKLVMEQTMRTAGLYKKINDAVAAYAQDNGIALVFVADELNVAKAQSPEQLTAMVTVRKILYAHPSFDITKAIQQKMNTAYQLNGHTAPATRGK